jgi:branched-chain amino acid transport system substrate-binding protein
MGLFVAVVLAITACGNRMSHRDVVAAMSASGAAVGSGIGAGDLGSGSPTDSGTAGVGSNSASVVGPSGSANTGAGSLGVAGSVNSAGTGPQGATVSAATGRLSPVVIGNVGTYSGVIGSIFHSGSGAALLAAKYLNAHGGLNGHPVNLVSADDGGDPSRNASIVKEMVETEHAIAFIGQLTPLSSTGSSAYLQSHNIPVIGGDLYDPVWYSNPDFFPQGTDQDKLVVAAGRVGIPFNHLRLGFLYCSETPICTNANRTLQSHQSQLSPAQLVYSAQISLAQPDYTAECLGAKNANVQLLFVASDPSSLGRVAANCAQQGYKPQIGAPGLAVNNASATDPNLEGLTTATPVFPWFASDTPPTQTFRQAIQQFAPNYTPDGTSSAVWTSAMLLAAASRSLGPIPSSAQLLQGLWLLKNFNIDGLSAVSLTFAQGSAATDSGGCYFYAQVVHGRWSTPLGTKAQC